MIRATLALAYSLALAGCAHTTALGKEDLQPGMSAGQVRQLMGEPDVRSFRDSDEAWQYHDVVGFAQCEYLTAWFKSGVLHGISTRRGGSVSGCGLGSKSIKWSEMPE